MTTVLRRGPSPRPVNNRDQYEGGNGPRWLQRPSHHYAPSEPKESRLVSFIKKAVPVALIILLLYQAYMAPSAASLRARARAAWESGVDVEAPASEVDNKAQIDPDLYLIVGVQNDPYFAETVAFSWRLKDANQGFKTRALAFPSKEKYLLWLERSRVPLNIPDQFSGEKSSVAVFKGVHFLGTGAALRADTHAAGFTVDQPSAQSKPQKAPDQQQEEQRKILRVKNDQQHSHLDTETANEKTNQQMEASEDINDEGQEATQQATTLPVTKAGVPLIIPAQVTFKNKIITGYRYSEGKKFTNYKPFAQVLEGWTFYYQAPLMASIILVQDQTSASNAMVRYPKSMVNNIGWGGQSCLGGSKGTQIQCRMNRAEYDGCPYESLKIQPFQARLWIQQECKDFFEQRCQDDSQLFIQKPSGGQHGFGMKVHRGCNLLREEYAALCDWQGSEYPKKKYIIMPYLQPALLDGHKFDVRSYGLIASLDPLLIFYSDGFVRRATARYSTDNLQDETAHITNSVKQDSKDDHFWDFARLSEYLHKQHAFPPDFMETIFRRRAMKITDFVFQAARSGFKQRKGRFQLFALDWIVDHQGGIHLLEVNSNPLVGSPYPGLGHHFPQIWAELMKLVIDIQTGQMPTSRLRSTSLSRYWHLVFSEYEETKPYNSCDAFAGDDNPSKDTIFGSTRKPDAISSKNLDEIQREIEQELQDEKLIEEWDTKEQAEASGIENTASFKPLNAIPEVSLDLGSRLSSVIPCPSQTVVGDFRKRCVLAPGAEDETEYHIIESGRPGPIVVVLAGVHGNEGAGVVAARHVAKNWRITKGTLVVLERANARGVAANSRFVPQSHSSPFYDLNRAFPVQTEMASNKFLALAIWEFMSEIKPDILFDLHEGRAFFASSTSQDQKQQQEMEGVIENVGSTTGGKVSKGNSIVTTVNAEPLAKVIADACNEDLNDLSRKFYVMAPPIHGGLAHKVNTAFGTKAMLFETTVVLPLETRARQHLFMLGAALRSVRMLAPDFDLSSGGDLEPCVATRRNCPLKRR